MSELWRIYGVSEVEHRIYFIKENTEKNMKSLFSFHLTK